MRINENRVMTESKIKRVEDIDFTDSVFDSKYCFEFRDFVFEQLPGDEFRVVLNETDDYDYVEDEELERELRVVWYAKQASK